MLRQTLIRRLYLRCQDDSLNAFQRGFSSAAAAIVIPVTRKQHISGPQPTTTSIDAHSKRGLSSTKSQFASEVPLEKHGKGSDLSEQEILETLEANDIDEIDAPDEVDDEMLLAPILSYLQEMRDASLKKEEIVREIRELCGEHLPEGVLNDAEVLVYKRLYGEPLPWPPEGEIEDMEDEEEPQTHGEQQLFNADGTRSRYTSDENFQGSGSGTQPLRPQGDIDLGTASVKESFGNEAAPNKPFNQRMRDVAESLGAQLVEPFEASERHEIAEDSEAEDQEEFEPTERAHPLTTLGKFSTKPSTIFMPHDEFLEPVQIMMSNFSNKHLKDTAERTFGGQGLPNSALTPRSAQGKQQRPIPLEASQHSMGEMEANAFVTTLMPPVYASITSVLIETRKRLGSTWLNNLLQKTGGPRVLDAGAGGAGILAWNEIMNAHWGSLHSSDRSPPPAPQTKAVVLTGSDALRTRASGILENTTFVPRLPDYIHTRSGPTLDDDRPAQRKKQFDVIIASHTLFGLQEEWMRKQQVQNLWSLLSDEGGVLILIEKGIPRGFEAIAGARELLLQRHIATPEGHSTVYDNDTDSDPIYEKEKGMIVAPCTNHQSCPMYKIPGISRGRKDICSFQQRFVRPPHLQRVIGGSDRNHEDVDFSYISVMKGEDLRTRTFNDWQSIADPLSAPQASSTTMGPSAEKSWMMEVKGGFEDVTPHTLAPGSDAKGDRSYMSSVPPMHALPRLIYPPLKRRGHVTMDLCTPAGQIERWTVPKSFSKQAYRDARKSKWGDIWALGAKIHTARNLRLGTPDGKDAKIKFGRAARLQNQAADMLERMEDEKLADMEMEGELEESILQGDNYVEDRGLLDEGEVPMQRRRPNNRERKAARRAERQTQAQGHAETATTSQIAVSDISIADDVLEAETPLSQPLSRPAPQTSTARSESISPTPAPAPKKTSAPKPKSTPEPRVVRSPFPSTSPSSQVSPSYRKTPATNTRFSLSPSSPPSTRSTTSSTIPSTSPSPASKSSLDPYIETYTPPSHRRSSNLEPDLAEWEAEYAADARRSLKGKRSDSFGKGASRAARRHDRALAADVVARAAAQTQTQTDAASQ